jgi:dipeptidyl aminopeptidase/acylaminoacyl peptidase
MRRDSRVLGSAILLVALLAGCEGGITVANSDSLAAIAQEVDEPYCCRVPVGAPPQPIGSVTLDVGARPAGFVDLTHVGFAIDRVTPVGALAFSWNGSFIADGRENDNDAGTDLPFDADRDVGGFEGNFPQVEGETPPRKLSFAARHCAFERVRFDVVVFEYQDLRGLPGLGFDFYNQSELAGTDHGFGSVKIISRQRQTIEVVNLGCETDERIVFARSDDNQPRDIWAATPQGAEEQITTDISDDLSPAWSPDHTRIAFVSDRDTPLYYELHTMDADGDNAAPATAFGNRWVDDPAWAPNGHEIVMTVAEPGLPDTDLWIVDLDLPLGPTNPRQLTSGLATDRSPTWSPDGQQIAFVRNADIFVVPADGSAPPVQRVADALANTVDWSSQGMLVFDRYDVQFIGRRIWRADAATGAPVERVNDGEQGFNDESPTWSADGTRIAFVREVAFAEAAEGEIHTMGEDGLNPQPIGDQPGDDRDPDW